MKTRLIIGVLAVVLTATYVYVKNKTKVNWSALQSVSVYTDARLGSSAKKISKADLAGMQSYQLDLNKAIPILERSKRKVRVVTVWKGYSYALAQFKDGTSLLMKLSHYDGFFMIQDVGSLNEVAEADREAWQAMIRSY